MWGSLNAYALSDRQGPLQLLIRSSHASTLLGYNVDTRSLLQVDVQSLEETSLLLHT